MRGVAEGGRPLLSLSLPPLCQRRRSRFPLPLHSSLALSLSRSPSSARPAEYLLLLPLQITEAEEEEAAAGGLTSLSLLPLLQPHGSGPFLPRQCLQVPETNILCSMYYHRGTGSIFDIHPQTPSLGK